MAFSGCCWLGHLAMATGNAEWGLVEAMCHQHVEEV